jgi:hypothetical protein
VLSRSRQQQLVQAVSARNGAENPELGFGPRPEPFLTEEKVDAERREAEIVFVFQSALRRNYDKGPML